MPFNVAFICWRSGGSWLSPTEMIYEASDKGFWELLGRVKDLEELEILKKCKESW